jgi:hypothetical protein
MLGYRHSRRFFFAPLWLSAALLFSWSAQSIASDSELKVGAAVRSITPDPLLPVSGGLGPTAPATEKRGEITARAVVFQQGKETVGIVVLDLLGFPSVLGNRVRKQVPRIAAANILVGATHSHSAPCCYAFPDGQGGHTGDLKYIDWVCQRAAEALNEAIDKLETAKLKTATDDANGKIAFNYYAPALYDRRMSVVQAIGGSGKPIVTLVNYAIHPEVLGADAGFVSPDCIGPCVTKIESELGGVAVFVNGAVGGMITADNRDFDKPGNPISAKWPSIRTWDECLRIGHTMADEAIRIIAEAQIQSSPMLTCAAKQVTFPVESEQIWGVVQYSPLKYPHDPKRRTVTTQVNLINLGDTQMLTIPGEALPNIGFYLKRKMSGRHNLVLGLTNDAFGYILTKVDFASFPRYDYITRTSLGELTGEILIRESLGLADRHPNPHSSKETAPVTQ